MSEEPLYGSWFRDFVSTLNIEPWNVFAPALQEGATPPVWGAELSYGVSVEVWCVGFGIRVQGLEWGSRVLFLVFGSGFRVHR